MDIDYDDGYPLLDFGFDIYAEDQVVIGPDGPEIGPIDSIWDNDSDDDACSDDDDTWIVEPPAKEEEEFYVLSEQELSCCHEEWEDYC